ncbi:hypothetical protein H8B15_09415 [Hymenobacter sp. BT507]|uniref:DUF922 domain-containing protein n=1 Tax=Hymenobacter citatus TaxID=2763506 RepID=A0ABR7MJA4_9BACT|nr:hypothetical protein [Hymenobacter citatus]MBC6611141.1 hypothetical protein [Hymenobacter citatus]
MPIHFRLPNFFQQRFPWLLWLLVWPLAAGRLPNTDKPLTLRPEPLALQPPTFRVAQVRDERPDRRAVAWLLPAPGTNPATPRPIDLQGGAAVALQQFATQSLPSQPSTRAVRVRIRALRITEKAAPGGRVEGEIQVQLAFDWLRPDAAPLLLTEYRSGARYGRLATDAAVVEPALRQVLAGGLRYLNGWLTRAAEQDARLATRVQPTFRYDQRQTEPDTLFYDPARPLAWSDFTGPPRAGNFAAAVFPGFSYQGKPRLRNGVIELDITLQVFVVRSSSWVGPGKNAYYLAHEQRHFDLVKLVAERFRRSATADSLTVEDYNSILQRQYLRSFMEMNRIQERYDAETHHGTNAAAQQRWDQQIEADLRRFGER